MYPYFAPNFQNKGFFLFYMLLFNVQDMIDLIKVDYFFNIPNQNLIGILFKNEVKKLV